MSNEITKLILDSLGEGIPALDQDLAGMMKKVQWSASIIISTKVAFHYMLSLSHLEFVLFIG
jgi:hypothetical protein